MPPPDAYTLPSDFDGEKSFMNNSRAFSFGISRDAYEKVYIPSRKISTDPTIPGPGKYTLLSTIGKDSRKFSLQGRTPYFHGNLIITFTKI